MIIPLNTSSNYSVTACSKMARFIVRCKSQSLGESVGGIFHDLNAEAIVGDNYNSALRCRQEEEVDCVEEIKMDSKTRGHIKEDVRLILACSRQKDISPASIIETIRAKTYRTTPTAEKGSPGEAGGGAHR